MQTARIGDECGCSDCVAPDVPPMPICPNGGGCAFPLLCGTSPEVCRREEAQMSLPDFGAPLDKEEARQLPMPGYCDNCPCDDCLEARLTARRA